VRSVPCVVPPVARAAERSPGPAAECTPTQYWRTSSRPSDANAQTRRRRRRLLLTAGSPGDGLTDTRTLLESVRVRESEALADLVASTGGDSLCSSSRQGTAVPAVKYCEGAASALAEVRRAVEAVPDGPGGASTAYSVLLEVHARWRAQSQTTGHKGPDWAGYLAGGLDALEQMIDDDGGFDELDVQD